MNKYVSVIVIFILIAVGVYGYNMYQDYQTLKLERDTLAQNQLALRDSLTQVSDSLIIATAFVRNLNVENADILKKFLALEARFAFYVDSSKNHGTVTPIITGDSVRIAFSGYRGIAQFDGFTLYNALTKQGSWELNLSFPNPIRSSVELFEENKIWKWRISSLTPGVTVMGTGAIDDDIYRRLQKYAPPSPPRHFMIGAVVGQHGGVGLGYTSEEWSVIGYYTVLNKYDDVYKNINVGLFWRF